MTQIHYEKVFHTSLAIIGLMLILLAIPDSSFGLKLQSKVNIGSGPISCSETDQGVNANQKGTTCDASGCSTDQCNMSGNSLTEFACVNGVKNPQNIPCSDSCYNGACRAKPNFLLIMADDMDPDLYGFSGHPAIKTPVIDSIASNATIFPNGQSSMSVCRPSLASLLSGKLPNENKIFANHTIGGDPLSTINALPQILKDDGYDTFVGGKFWEGSPTAYGFTHVGEGILDFGRVTQQSFFDFIDYTENSNKPFFAWYAPSLPHLPHNPPGQFVNAFSDNDIEIPPWVDLSDHADFIEDQKNFFGTIYWFDTLIGEAINKLAQTNQLDNTIIIYAADNGYSYGHLSKYGMLEKGLRTPIIVKVPDALMATKTLNPPASLIDIPKTILDYAGVDTSSLDNDVRTWLSLKPLVEGASDIFRDTLAQGVYSEAYVPTGSDPETAYAHALYAVNVRSSGHKYIQYVKDVNEEITPIMSNYAEFIPRQAGDEEFYALQSDPYEQNNLIDDPSYAQQISSFRQKANDLKNQIASALNNDPSPTGLTSSVVINAQTYLPNCNFNQVYLNKNDCLCGNKISTQDLLEGRKINFARWSQFIDDDILCTPDSQPKYICRNLVLDSETQRSPIPGEVTIRLKTGVSFEEIESLLDKNEIIIRKQPCQWQRGSKFNTMVVEPPIGQELEALETLQGSDLVLHAEQNQQVVCLPQGPVR